MYNLNTNANRKNNLGLQSAFSHLDKQLESLFAGFPLTFEFEGKASTGQSNVRKLRGHWSESEEGYTVSYDVPGVRREDVTIEVEDKVLGLTAKRVFGTPAADEESKSTLEYKAAFELPEGTDPTKISAAYDAGVLTLVLPKGEKAKPRRIEIGGN